ncbi:DNA-binding protein [Hydrogenophaga borbori]
MEKHGTSFSADQISRARSEFKQAGVSISDWAQRHGVPAALVYSVLSGKSQCTRGRSHHVAVLLGLKAPPDRPSVKNLLPEHLVGTESVAPTN